MHGQHTPPCQDRVGSSSERLASGGGGSGTGRARHPAGRACTPGTACGFGRSRSLGRSRATHARRRIQYPRSRIGRPRPQMYEGPADPVTPRTHLPRRTKRGHVAFTEAGGRPRGIHGSRGEATWHSWKQGGGHVAFMEAGGGHVQATWSPMCYCGRLQATGYRLQATRTHRAMPSRVCQPRPRLVEV